MLVSRTGFTGDLGYELWIEAARAEKLWDALFAAGEPHGIMPIGNQALDIARIEAGFIQAGVEFVPAAQAVRPDRGRSPFELGLGRLVHFDKPLFNGKKALLEERERGSRYRLVRLDVEGNKPAADSFICNRKQEVVGHVTSAVWSPSAKMNVALASLETPWGRPDDELYAEVYYNSELQWKRLMARCKTLEGAFLRPAAPALNPGGLLNERKGDRSILSPFPLPSFLRRQESSEKNIPYKEFCCLLDSRLRGNDEGEAGMTNMARFTMLRI